MPRLTSNPLAAAALGQLAAPLAFIDPLFIPLILLRRCDRRGPQHFVPLDRNNVHQLSGSARSGRAGCSSATTR
jgi:hypothetical protein